MTQTVAAIRSNVVVSTFCNLSMTSLAVAVNLLPLLLTTLARDLGGGRLADEQLGRIGAITFAGLVGGIIVTGPFADRLGGRIFAAGGNVMIAAGLAVLGMAAGYGAVLVAAFVMGFGAGTLDVILTPIVSATSPDRRTASMNLLHSFYSIGAVATILVGSLALRCGVHWRSLALSLLPAPLTIGICILFLSLPPLTESGQKQTSITSLIRQKSLLLILAAIFLGGATELGLAYWLPAYAEKTLGYSRWTAGMSFLGFSLAMAVGRIGVTFLPRDFRPIQLMTASSAACAVLLIGATLSSSDSLALWCCLLTGLGVSCLWPSTLAAAGDRFPQGGAAMFGVCSAIGNFSGIAMPWAVGIVADRSSLRCGLATIIFCPLLLLAVLTCLSRVNGSVEAAKHNN